MTYLQNNKHQQYLAQLPKILQKIEDIKILYSPKEFYNTLLQAILNAKKRIYLVTLYLEQDQGGKSILNSLFKIKKTYPLLQIIILVDLNRAQRGRMGITTPKTNANWYHYMALMNPGIEIPIYGIPIHFREALGVLHLKGFIIDDQVIYSGASLNNVYLHFNDIYRYDRYQIIFNKQLADTMQNYINQYLLTASATIRLDNIKKIKNIKIRNKICLFREILRKVNYCYQGNSYTNKLSITPIVGLGKKNQLNKTIHHLICSTSKKLTLYTPYFNMPMILLKDIINLLHQEKQIEIIVGDKIASDFYIPENESFKIIGIIPYLYEINLRLFIKKLQYFITNGQLSVRLWRNGINTFHLKGIGVDNIWQLLTGNNFNSRAWQLDLENALLLYDPELMLKHQFERELSIIRTHTKLIKHYTLLEDIADYPVKIKKIIRRIHHIRIDLIIKKIL